MLTLSGFRLLGELLQGLVGISRLVFLIQRLEEGLIVAAVFGPALQ